MNVETLKVLIRHLLGAMGGGGVMVADSDLTQLASGLLVLISIAMSIYDKRRKDDDEDDEDDEPRPLVQRPRVVKYGKRDR